MQKKYFGTDGIRGPVDGPLINSNFMLQLGYAAGQVLKKNKASTVLIGRDTRESGENLAMALQKGLSAAGIEVKLLGVLPTPAVAYLTQSLSASAGAVISASHNAYQDNGIKFFNSNGFKLSDDLELDIESQLACLSEKEISSPSRAVAHLSDAADRYIKYCKTIFPLKLNLKLVIDCANGATYQVAPTIFRELGADVVVIHGQPDGKNINENCGATHLKSLVASVKQHQADVGLAFDGDGDRLIMVDHQGEIVDGDEILCILAMDQLARLKDQQGVVGTVMSNLGLEQALVKSGIAFERAAVGDRYVLEALLKNNWILGGEASGHIVNLDYATTGDGVITALQVLRIIGTSEKSLHELKRVMIKRPQILINVPVSNMINLNDYPELTKAIQEMEASLKDEGRILLRPSGTEPVIRVMVEGNEALQVKQAAETLAKIVAEATQH